MYFVVEYIEGGQAFAAKFASEEGARRFAHAIEGAFLDFYSEEEVVDKKLEYQVFRRVRNLNR